MSYYTEPDGPTPEQEAAWDYENLREYCDQLELALRGIAEGNLGEEPWQANYDKIRAVAKEALTRLKGG